jgi:serine/threonine protein kinase
VLICGCSGHVRLTDFGLSKEGVTHASTGARTFSGTTEYLAPEILQHRGHGRAVDWWSLGTLLYEMITGTPPFYSSDKGELFYKILHSTIVFPSFVPLSARNLLEALLTREPSRRLGSGPEDSLAIKRHCFFADVDWDRCVCATMSVEHYSRLA